MNVIHIAVVVVMAMVPVAAVVATSPVTATVVNATVVADAESPIAGIPAIISTGPAPIPRSP
jgi:hypothetical protein